VVSIRSEKTNDRLFFFLFLCYFLNIIAFLHIVYTFLLLSERRFSLATVTRKSFTGAI
jgi:hypothetical protein